MDWCFITPVNCNPSNCPALCTIQRNQDSVPPVEAPRIQTFFRRMLGNSRIFFVATNSFAPRRIIPAPTLKGNYPITKKLNYESEQFLDVKLGMAQSILINDPKHVTCCHF